MPSIATQQYDVPDGVRVALSESLGAVAHEVRQPLSNIEAIAYYLSMILPASDGKVQAQLARIRELVEQSNWILSSALSLAASSRSAPQPLALEELITEAVTSSGATDIRLALRGDLPLVHLDPREGRELVDSVLMLFRNMADGATPIVVTTSAPAEGGVILEIGVSGDWSRGVGGAGSQLALESTRRIAAAHGGTFVVEGAADTGNPAGGIRGRLMLP